MKQLSKILTKAKEIAGILTIVSLFVTAAIGAWQLLSSLRAGALGYSVTALVTAAAAYFCIELYQRSK